MAKKGMARPDWAKLHPKNQVSPVPQIQGKAKSGKKKVNPIIAGTEGAELKVWHEKPIPKELYSTIDLVPHDVSFFGDEGLHPNAEGFDHYFKNLYTEIQKHI